MATGTLGKIRNPWAVIGLSIITLGIYALYWQYATFKELKDYSGNGIGGGLGLLFAILLITAIGIPASTITARPSCCSPCAACSPARPRAGSGSCRRTARSGFRPA